MLVLRPSHTAVAIANQGNSLANITFQLFDTNGVDAFPAVQRFVVVKAHTAFFRRPALPVSPRWILWNAANHEYFAGDCNELSFRHSLLHGPRNSVAVTWVLLWARSMTARFSP